MGIGYAGKVSACCGGDVVSPYHTTGEIESAPFVSKRKWVPDLCSEVEGLLFIVLLIPKRISAYRVSSNIV